MAPKKLRSLQDASGHPVRLLLPGAFLVKGEMLEGKDFAEVGDGKQETGLVGVHRLLDLSRLWFGFKVILWRSSINTSLDFRVWLEFSMSSLFLNAFIVFCFNLNGAPCFGYFDLFCNDCCSWVYQRARAVFVFIKGVDSL